MSAAHEPVQPEGNLRNRLGAYEYPKIVPAPNGSKESKGAASPVFSRDQHRCRSGKFSIKRPT